jgi:hypothetical protein
MANNLVDLDPEGSGDLVRLGRDLNELGICIINSSFKELVGIGINLVFFSKTPKAANHAISG